MVAANLLQDNQEKPDYTGVPSVVFTIPELTRVGLLKTEARERGLDVTSKFNDIDDWYSVVRVGETHAAAKVLVENGSGRIVGAHILGRRRASSSTSLGSVCGPGFALPISRTLSALIRFTGPISAISSSQLC